MVRVWGILWLGKLKLPSDVKRGRCSVLGDFNATPVMIMRWGYGRWALLPTRQRLWERNHHYHILTRIGKLHSTPVKSSKPTSVGSEKNKLVLPNFLIFFQTVGIAADWYKVASHQWVTTLCPNSKFEKKSRLKVDVDLYLGYTN